MLESAKPRAVNLPGHRIRSTATKILKLCPEAPLSTTSTCHHQPAITVVCISDTHNTKPSIPPGDLLLHAGDLTNDGSFDEIQEQLRWLSSQPHAHKVVVAGNHDVLLDERFLAKHPERDYPSNAGRDARDLDWGSVTYLQRDEVVTLDLKVPRREERDAKKPLQRAVKIYANPITPRYGISAFQLPRHEDVWSGCVPDDADIVLTHGPPFGHLDGALRSGCMYLAEEIRRARPRLVVFGHIHVGYGREDVVFHGVRRAFERIQAREGGWFAVLWMGLSVLGRCVIPRKWRDGKETTLVNAAVVGGEGHEFLNDPVVIKI